MPAKSQAQRGYLNAHFGHAWVKAHHFDNRGKLPDHVGDSPMHQGRHDTGKPHRPHKTKGHMHKGGHHSSHAKANHAHGLPHDVFAHDGKDYGSGGAKGGFVGQGNQCHSD